MSEKLNQRQPLLQAEPEQHSLKKKKGTSDTASHSASFSCQLQEPPTTYRKEAVSPAVIVQDYTKRLTGKKSVLCSFCARKKRYIYFMAAKVVDLHLVMACPKNIFNLTA